MIDIYSLSPEWLAEKRRVYKKSDPSIMERVIFALFLLEQLKQSGLYFIFKGGTSLLLLLDQPSRFSIDIDIIVEPSITKEQLEKILVNIKSSGVFKSIDLDSRRSYKSNIPKAHYKFIYNSHVLGKEQEILLDVLFTKNPYPQVQQRPIKSEWIKIKDEPIAVITPDINSITGDKLTAFAPDTIGVPYKKDKEREIIKQLYDLGVLFDNITDVSLVHKSFTTIATDEIKYRPEKTITIDDVLNDIINTGIILANKEQQPSSIEADKYNELTTGIRQFSAFIYTNTFPLEKAITASAKAAYLASVIKSKYNGELAKYNPSMLQKDYLITHPQYNFLNKKIKNIPGGALFYWNEAIIGI